MLTHKWLVLLLAVPILAACAPRRADGGGLDAAAEDYVRLVLAVGRHDDNFVDAYYGPAEWSSEADAGEPVPIPALLDRARGVLDQVRNAEPSGRRTFLEAQLVAVEASLQRLAGESIPLDEEARLLYDLEPPVRRVEEFEEARARLEALLPGDGPLRDRVRAFRDDFIVPPERLEAVVDAALQETRERTRALVALPDDESFRVSYVRDKSWSAYNWYQGGHASLIEVNLDLPIEIGPIFRTLAHEAYPGHHTYNVLLEDRLVEGNGWPEFQVYPLFSPQSLLAEGTANAGISVIFSPEEEWAFLEEVLAPEAGLEGRDFAKYRQVLEALRPLRYVRGEAARLLLDRDAPPEEVAAFMVQHALMTEGRARKAVDFSRTYRSYVFNYTAGEDLVREYIGAGDDRLARFFDLLQRPVTPAGLVAELREGEAS